MRSHDQLKTKLVMLVTYGWGNSATMSHDPLTT